MKLFHSLVSLILLALCCLGIPKSVQAEDASLDYSLYGSFLHTGDIPNVLFLFSSIEENASFDLRRALRAHQIDIIVLSSPGGSVWEGLQMAGIIHDNDLTTFIPEQGLDGKGNCASACSFMFFAGENRAAKGALGVHQFFSSNSQAIAEVGNVEQGVQFTTSEIISFLNEFDTPPFVFERMFQQSDMYYFDPDEMSQITTLNQLETENMSKEISRFVASLADRIERQKQLVSLDGSWKMTLCGKETEVEIRKTSRDSYSVESDKIEATLNFSAPLKLFEMSCSEFEGNNCTRYEANKIQTSISGRYFFQSRGYDNGYYNDGAWINILKFHNSMELKQDHWPEFDSNVLVSLRNTDPDSGCGLSFWKLDTPTLQQVMQD